MCVCTCVSRGMRMHACVHVSVCVCMRIVLSMLIANYINFVESVLDVVEILTRAPPLNH